MNKQKNSENFKEINTYNKEKKITTTTTQN